MILEQWLRKRFVRLHGEGAANQADFYRCHTCGKLVTWNKIRKADVCCSGRVIPTNPTSWETVKVLCLPWMV